MTNILNQPIQTVDDVKPKNDHNLDLFIYDDDSDDEDNPNDPSSIEGTIVSNGPRYRHFSTSISSMFRDPKDCCSLVCCGIFQSDLTFFLLHGKRPPKSSFKDRILSFIFLPLLLLWLGSVIRRQFSINETIEQSSTEQDEDIQYNFLIGILSYLPFISYLILQTCWIQCWRRDVRKAVLKRAVRHDNCDEDDTNETRTHSGGDTVLDTASDISLLRKNDPFISQAHQLCCGCYSRDDRDTGADQVISDKKKNFCTELWKLISFLFCGCCGCWCQCMGICALAQEARELKRLTPKEDQMIDYITFEPYSNYFRKIHYLRSSGNLSFLHHFRALSQLSKKLIQALGLFFLFFFLYALIDLNHGKNLGHWLMVIATFIQAFFILYLVYWRNNRTNISMDAIIKYFASGFFLSIPIAMCFENVASFILNVVNVIILLLSTNTLDQQRRMGEYDNQYEYYGGYYDNSEGESNGNSAEIELMVQYIDNLKENTFQVFLQIFLTSFVTAALIEELCKHFAFFMLDHPDFFSPSFVLTSRPTNFESSESETNGGDPYHEIELSSNVNARINDDARETSESSDCQPHPNENNSGLSNSQTLLSSGTKITIAMVSVAVGFACNENLVYIFLGSGGNLSNELTILLQRSIFPIHPICAAIQSIGVCRRDLEGDESFTLGRIVYPAIFLHGLFDFVVLSLPTFFLLPHLDELKEYWIKRAVEGPEIDINDPLVMDMESIFHNSNTITMVIGAIITFAGFGYFLAKSSLQKYRLKDLDKESAEYNSRLL